jgi:hypothetical protein
MVCYPCALHIVSPHSCATGNLSLCLQEVGGTVFGYDPSTDIVMLKEPGTHGGVVNLRLYKAAQLQVCPHSGRLVCVRLSQQQQAGPVALRLESAVWPSDCTQTPPALGYIDMQRKNACALQWSRQQQQTGS